MVQAAGSINDDKTLVITTGGTIESFYNPEEGTPYHVPLPDHVDETCIPAALRKLGLEGQCDVLPLAMKDSKDVTTAMLDHIVHQAVISNYKHIVIVHGTDTMPVHARYLKRRVEEYGSLDDMDKKTFIFTGAMEPLRDKTFAWRDASDGWENLHRAIFADKNQVPGVYVEMGSRFAASLGDGPWEADTVKKFVQPADETPGTLVSHSEFQRDDPTQHVCIAF